MKRLLISEHLLDDPPMLANVLRQVLDEANGEPVLIGLTTDSLGAFLHPQNDESA